MILLTTLEGAKAKAIGMVGNAEEAVRYPYTPIAT